MWSQVIGIKKHLIIKYRGLYSIKVLIIMIPFGINIMNVISIRII